MTAALLKPQPVYNSIYTSAVSTVANVPKCGFCNILVKERLTTSQIRFTELKVKLLVSCVLL